MNMIYVDSSELKRYLLKCIDEIILRLERSVYELIMRRNDDIHLELTKMITIATSHANSCARLVEIENEVDNYRRNGIKILQDKHTDLIKWVGITLYGTFYPFSEDDLIALHETSEFLKEIYQKLDVAESKIF
jgi:hypothetical protein